MSAPAGTAVSIVIGPAEHGVVAHALRLAAAAGIDVCRWREPPAALDTDIRIARAAVVHLHFTDRLFGPDADSSAGHFVELVDRLRCRVIVSMHDVPELDSSDRTARRRTAYRLVADHADLIVVASRHERARLWACGIDGEVRIAPLPIEPVRPFGVDGGRRASAPARALRTIGLLGFVYPGKGHDDVLDAMGATPDDVALVALGRPSDGHEALASTLRRSATERGRHLAITGFLAERELTGCLAAVDVPVVPAQQVSASASLHRWIGAGRRPLVAANCFTRELAAAAPGTMQLYDPAAPAELQDAIAAALADPVSTWHDGWLPVGYSLAAIAALHRRWYRRRSERR